MASYRPLHGTLNDWWKMYVYNPVYTPIMKNVGVFGDIFCEYIDRSIDGSPAVGGGRSRRQEQEEELRRRKGGRKEGWRRLLSTHPQNSGLPFQTLLSCSCLLSIVGLCVVLFSLSEPRSARKMAVSLLLQLYTFPLVCLPLSFYFFFPRSLFIPLDYCVSCVRADFPFDFPPFSSPLALCILRCVLFTLILVWSLRFKQPLSLVLKTDTFVDSCSVILAQAGRWISLPHHIDRSATMVDVRQDWSK